MARQENFLGCNYSAGGSGGSSGGDGGVSSGRLLKKVKQKKVPQRGLGVAQLEKIRLEEQQKIDSLEVLGRNSIDSPGDIAQFLPVNCPKFMSGLPSVYSSVPSVASTNLLYRQAASVPSVLSNESPLQVSKQVSGNIREMELTTVSGLGQGTWPMLWNGNYSLVGEKPNGFGCEAQVMLPPYDLTSPPPVLTPPIMSKQLAQQFQQPSSPLMVSASPGISRSSVVLRSQMEPPSNQSSRGDNYTASWSEEDKIVGAKRPYPFTLESHLICSTYAGPISRSDEMASSSNGRKPHMEPRNKCIREDPLSSTVLPKLNLGEVTRDNGRLPVDFLTLAPPKFASSPPDLKHKGSWDYSDNQGHKLSAFEPEGNEGHKLSEFDPMLSQEFVKNQIHQPGPSGSTKRSFSFLPIKHQTEQTTSCVSNEDGEKGEALDLNLKL